MDVQQLDIKQINKSGCVLGQGLWVTNWWMLKVTTAFKSKYVDIVFRTQSKQK